ncbi:MAG TPA: AAA family ATPase [Thermodesulfovibrionales bacterium]|nr:AAA family ATPase [Thermodesulfovibrionales bacterium]
MLTRLKVSNFKKVDNVDIELGKTVVLIGPNNSGKTSALQALALWDIGLRQWNAKREGKASPEKRPGVAINRLEMISIPVPNLNLLWSDLHTRDKEQVEGKSRTKNIRIDVIVEGVTNDRNWSCGIEFDYSGEESCSCRPVRKPGFEGKPVKEAKFTEIPNEANEVKIAFLPPMSGLAAVEPKLEPGRLNVLLGEGQTAQVLRNLCYQIYEKSDGTSDWMELTDRLKMLFGIELIPPQYIKERGEIKMSYKEQSGKQFDISSSGRGLQQTLLLLAHLYANPNTVLLLDEPDAHLEVLRQRQTYQLITDIAEKKGSQIISASHSEVVLNEAADRDVVIAFVGKPHRIDDRGSQVLKSLKEIGFDHYYLAEETGWVLYLEGSTDFAILKAFAETLMHKEAIDALARPFVHYVQNQPNKVNDHFWALKYARNDLTGLAIFDRLDRTLPDNMGTVALQWKKRELENYLCMEEVLLAYAKHDLPDDLFGRAEEARRLNAMKESISEVASALKTLKRLEIWSPDIKATDEFLDPLFDKYFEKLGLTNLLRKSDYHILARLVPKDKIDPEIIEKLDAIVETAKKAKPRVD